MNGIGDLGAFSPDKLNSRRYNYLRIAVSALAKASDRITIVSGHEESLQYLSGGNIHQIISGSLNNRSATKISKDKITTIGGSLDFEGKFTFGEKGFAKLEYFEDGSSKVTFLSIDGAKNSFKVHDALDTQEKNKDFPTLVQETKSEAVLSDKAALDKSGFYKFLWGDRYR